MKDLKNEEKDYYYKVKFLIAFFALGFFAFGEYDRADFLIMFLIFINTVRI